MAEYLQPGTLEEAAGMLAAHGSSLAIVAGGTSAMRFKVPEAEHVMGVRGLGMNGIERSSGGLSLGAGVTMSQIRDSLPIPALQQAAAGIGGPAVQNMATVGGNIFARQPYGDVAVVLLALDATVTFSTVNGEQTQKLEDFYTSGAEADGLLTRIDCAAPGGELVYLKCGRRRFNSPTVIAVAACVLVSRRRDSDARRPFRTPLPWLIAPLAILGCIYLFGSLQSKTQIAFAIWNAIGLGVYFLNVLWRTRAGRA